MRFICLQALAISLTAFLPLHGKAAEPDPPPADPAEEAATPVSGNAEGLWFPVGETVHYKIYWGVIPVAHSTATTEWVEEDGRTLLAIRFRTHSNSYLTPIYPVDDFLESLVDPETFLPLRFTKKLNEGRYHCDETTVFDRENLMATWKSNVSDQKKEYAIEPDTRDLISFMYTMRTQKVDVGEKLQYRVMADEKLYDLYVETKKRERVKLDRFGKVESICMEPTAAFQGLFVRKGKMVMWVSEDDRRLMTKALIDTPFANVHIKLDKVTGPGDDFWVEEVEEKDSENKRNRRKRR